MKQHDGAQHSHLTRSRPENPAFVWGITRPNPGLLRARGTDQSRIHEPGCRTPRGGRQGEKLLELRRELASVSKRKGLRLVTDGFSELSLRRGRTG